jgi:peptidoglycan/xylan/chitin deacetylase (PgdA/CDA1 family)
MRQPAVTATLVRCARAAARRARPVRPAILMYHRVAEETADPWGLAVSPQHFDEQLAWLARHRVVMPLAELAERHRDGRLPRRAVAITFDDGYACNATRAVPALARHGLPATFFLATRPIDRGREFWWDDLQRMVFGAGAEQLRVRLGDRELDVAIGPRDDAAWQWKPWAPPSGPRQTGFLALWRELRLLTPDEQDAALHDLRRQTTTPVTPRSEHRPMTPAEVRTIAATHGIDIGGHTLTHPSLHHWPSAEQQAEIEGGRDACAALTGRAPVVFAYPYGDFDARSVDAARAAGFRAACTTVGAAVTRDSDSLMLPRMTVGDWGADRLARTLRTL